jgi:hypothetical protein
MQVQGNRLRLMDRTLEREAEMQQDHVTMPRRTALNTNSDGFPPCEGSG